MEIYLVSHTEVQVRKGVCFGQSEIPLSPNFPTELQSVKIRLREGIEAKFYTSPEKRCLLLAEKLWDKEITVDERLKELNFGDWEMKPWNEISPAKLSAWMNNFVYEKCPGGESYDMLYSRAVEFINEITKEGFHRTCIISHAGWIRSVICYILSIPQQRIFSIQIDPGGISKITINGEMQVVGFINR